MRCLRVTLLSICTSAALLAPASARTLTAIDTPAASTPEQTALDAGRRYGERLGARSPVLEVRRVVQLRGGYAVRLRQLHGGLPVVGAELHVLVLGGRVVALSGDLRELSPSAPKATLSAAQAAVALQAKLPCTVRRAELVVWPDGDRARPAWLLDALALQPRFGLWAVAVDAERGSVLWGRSAMRHAKGRVYPTNPVKSSLEELPLLGLYKGDTLTGEHADVQRCAQVQESQLSCDRKAVPDAWGNYFFAPDDPSLEDPFAEVSAYFHVDSFHRYLAQRFGFARLGTQQQIKVIANFQYKDLKGNMVGYPNAFFGDVDGDGRGDLVIGQAKTDYAYDGDVVYHEFTHSIVDEIAGLEPIIDSEGFNLMPLALSEAFADLFAAIYTRDPVVGDYAGGNAGGIRNLVGQASCPDALQGESHTDGLIWGRAVWAIRENAPQRDQLEDALYKTLAALDKHAGIADAAAVLLKVAQVEYPTLLPVVQAELAQRGVAGCSRIVPLAPDVQKTGYLFGTADVVGLLAVPGPMQYKVDVPQNALEVSIYISGGGYHGGKVGAYLRRAASVSYHGAKVVYDRAMPSSEQMVTFSVSSDKDTLVPGEPIYVLPMNEGAYESSYRIYYSQKLDAPPPDAAPPVGPDAQVGVKADGGPPATAQPDPTAPGGCACTTPHTRGSPGDPLLLLALGGALLVLRRARRRA